MDDHKTEVNPSTNTTWKRPDEAMRMHLLKKKRNALQARMCTRNSNSSNSNYESNCDPFSSYFTRSEPQKRKNPFRCQLSKRLKDDDKSGNITSSELDNSSDTSLFQLLTADSLPSKRSDVLQTSFASIFTRLQEQPSEECVMDKESGEKYVPVDWSLKSKIRFLSKKPFPWNMKPKTCEEASGITGFVRCVNSGLSPEKLRKWSCSLDTSPNARFHQCCLVWQYPSYPWLSLFPRTAGRVSSTASSFVVGNSQLRDCLHREWGENLRSLFQLVRALQCPYFYVCANSFTCLFRAAGISGQTDIHAFVTPTTSGFRQLLKNEDVVYSMPLRKSRGSSKRLSSDNSDTGYESLDSLVDDPSQSGMPQSSKVVTGEDYEDDDDDDETADQWLQSMGMEASEIRKLNAQQEKLAAEKAREIDQSPESLVYVEGVEVQALFNFLMNCKSAVASTGPLAGIPPTLLAPVAFRGASLRPLKVQQSQVKVDTQSYHSIEIKGPILPHTIHNLCGLMQQAQEFSITFAHVESTKAFSLAVELSEEQEENKPKNELEGTSPLKQGISTSVITPTKTPTSNALCKENLSDCGLPRSLINTFCCPDTSRICLVESIRCNGDGTFSWT